MQSVSSLLSKNISGNSTFHPLLSFPSDPIPLPRPALLGAGQRARGLYTSVHISKASSHIIKYVISSLEEYAFITTRKSSSHLGFWVSRDLLPSRGSLTHSLFPFLPTPSCPPLGALCTWIPSQLERALPTAFPWQTATLGGPRPREAHTGSSGSTWESRPRVLGAWSGLWALGRGHSHWLHGGHKAIWSLRV